MEEILVCCGSLIFLGAILLGFFAFSSLVRKPYYPNSPADAFVNDIRERRESSRNRLDALLAVIGIWLGLPSLCAISQEMVNTIVSLDSIDKSVGITIKLVTDTCLLGGLFSGLIILVLVTVTSWSTSSLGMAISSRWEKIKAWFAARRKKHGDNDEKASPDKEFKKDEKKTQDPDTLQEMSREISKIVFEVVTSKLFEFELDRRKKEAADAPSKSAIEVQPRTESPSEKKQELALVTTHNDDENDKLSLDHASKMPQSNFDTTLQVNVVEKQESTNSPSDLLDEQGMSIYVKKIRKRNPNFP
jgi:hypothetical protein